MIIRFFQPKNLESRMSRLDSEESLKSKKSPGRYACRAGEGRYAPSCLSTSEYITCLGQPSARGGCYRWIARHRYQQSFEPAGAHPVSDRLASCSLRSLLVLWESFDDPCLYFTLTISHSLSCADITSSRREEKLGDTSSSWYCGFTTSSLPKFRRGYRC